MNVETRSFWRRSRAAMLLLAVFGSFIFSPAGAQSQPANDNFANAQSINGETGSIAGSNDNATGEAGEPDHLDSSSGRSIWYTWTAPFDGTAEFNTSGSDFDTLLAVYTGNNVGSLQLVADNDDASISGGISALQFNAVAGTTYQIAVDGFLGDSGNLTLNWNLSAITRSAGQFTFTSRTYSCSEWDSDSNARTWPNVSSSGGLLVTVTRVNGSAGKTLVDYSTLDGTALAGVSTNGHYTATSGTLTFKDYQMSANFVVPIIYDRGTNKVGTNILNASRQFSVQLSNPRFADDEQAVGVSLPELGAVTNAVCTINDIDVNPATKAKPEYVFNFERSVYSCPEWIGTARVYVKRGGSTNAACSVSYRINYGPSENSAHQYPLQAGSDYVTPDADYTVVTGTLNWAEDDFVSKPIDIDILNDSAVEFNEDMRLELFNPPTGGVIGSIGQATLTIRFDDQPAGAVDLTYNKDNNSGTFPPYNPSPGANSTVYSVLVRSDDKALIAGDFTSYNATPRNRIALIDSTGQIDTSFNPGSGADNFITSMALDDTGRIVVGGGFTSFNGLQRYGVARLSSTGSIDTAFGPGLGADGTVWAVATVSNKVYVAGDFTTFNGVSRKHVARLNEDGSVDPTFDTSVGPDGAVFALAVQPDGAVLIGGEFSGIGAVNRKAIARLNSNGSIDNSFSVGTGADDVVYALALQGDGKVVLGGAFTLVNLFQRKGLARLNADGSVDTTFDAGSGADDTVYAITLSGNSIYVGGLFRSINGTRRVGLAKLFPEGYVDTSFLDTAYNQYAGVTTPDLASGHHFVFSVGAQSNGAVLIGGGFDQVGGGSTRTDVHPRKNVARLVGGSTTGPGNIGFTSSTYSADEGMQLYVSISRDNGNLGAGSATFSPQALPSGAGAAEYGIDFDFDDSSYGNPTYPSRHPSSQMKSSGYSGGNNTIPGGADIYINVLDDSEIEGTESLNMELSAPTAADIFFLGGENIPLGTALGLSKAALSIVDNDALPGVLSFSTDNFTVNEDGATATITVTRTNGSSGAVTVQYATSNGSNSASERNAIAPADYAARTGTLTFNPGQTTRTFTISIVDDTTVEQDEDINLRLFGVTGGATLGVANSKLTIIDNDFPAGKVSFSSAVYTTSESLGLATITVARTGGSIGALSVPFIASNLVASATNALSNPPNTNSFDYYATNGVLTWNSGDTAPKTFTIPLARDGVVEGTEKIDVRLGMPSVGTNGVGPITNAIVNILNEDFYGNFAFSTSDYYTTDNAGVLSLIVVRNSGIAGTATVNYAISDGTATNGMHFSGANGTLIFPPGVSSTNVDIYLFEQIDPPYNNRSLTVTLSSPTPVGANAAGLGTPSAAVVHIIDHHIANEPAGSVDTSFVPFPGANNYVYALALQPDGKVLVGGDFTQFNGYGRNRIARLEENGVLDVKFSSASLGANSTIRSIVPQTDGRILVSGNFTNVNGVPRNYIARLNLDGLLDTSFNPGAGADGAVYAMAETFVGNQPRIYAVGAFSTFNGIQRNGIVRLSTNGVVDTAFVPSLGGNGTIYTIFAYPTNSVFAGKILVGGDFTMFNNVPRNRLARLNADGSVDMTFNPGSGAANSVRAIAVQTDGKILVGGLFTNFNGSAFNHIVRLKPAYTNETDPIDWTFNVGVGANDSVYSIAIQNDGKILLGGEFTTASGVTRNRLTRLNRDGNVDPTINFGIGANGFISSVIVQPNGEILIGGGFTSVDDLARPSVARIHGGGLSGSGTLEFSSGDYRVLESTNAVISIRRRGGTSQPSVPVTVNFDTSSVVGGATAGQDYTAVHANLQFPIGETFRTVVVPILNDTFVENDETVRLTLSGETGEAIVTNQPVADLTIVSDDSQFSFSAGTYRRPENAIDGAATITIVRSGSLVTSSSVTFTTTGQGTATAGLDFVPVTTNLLFSPGESNKTVTIPIVNDTVIEGDQTVSLNLTNLVGSYPGTYLQAELTIVDDDFGPGNISFAQPSYIVREEISSVVVVLVRTNGTTGVVAVNYATAEGSAKSGADYSGVSGTIVFADTETTKTITIPILDDSLVEPNENFTLGIFNPTGGAQLTGLTNVNIVIEDNEFGPGSLDTTFNPGGGANAWIRSVAVQPDGKLVIGGAFTLFDGTNRNYIARLQPNGPLDTAFNPGGGANAAVSSVAIMSDGKIALAGSFTNINGTAFNRAGRLFTNGLVDTNFNQPTGLNAAANSMAIQPDGKALVGGAFSSPTAGNARLRVNGSLDSTFLIGSGASGTVYTVFLQTTNVLGTTQAKSIFLGGEFTAVNGTPASKVARLHLDGLVDQTFTGPTITNGRVYAVLAQFDGKLLIAGDFTFTANSITYQRIARLNVDGTVDTNFNAGTGPNNTVYCLALQLDGKIFIGGDFTSINGTDRNRVARLNPNGSPDLTFDPGSGADNTVYGVTVLADGKVIIAGDFSTVNGFSRHGIARLSGDDMRPAFQAKVFSSGSINFSIKTVPTYSYVLQGSDNLITWTTLSSYTAPQDPAVGTVWNVSDADAISFNHRFYRVQQVSP